MTKKQSTKTAPTVQPIEELEDGSLVFKTNSAAVRRIVKPDGKEVFEVSGRILGQPTAFPPENLDADPPVVPTGINIRLTSKHRGPNTWWEIKAWKEGVVPILGEGYVGNAKFTDREPLSPGDAIVVTAPVEDPPETNIKGKGGKIIMGPDGKTPIIRLNWIVNYASQIELIERAKAPNFKRLGAGQSKANTKKAPAPRFF